MKPSINLDDIDEVLNYGTPDDVRACLELVADTLHGYRRVACIHVIDEYEQFIADNEEGTE
jgi:hypothetical protein